VGSFRSRGRPRQRLRCRRPLLQVHHVARVLPRQHLRTRRRKTHRRLRLSLLPCVPSPRRRTVPTLRELHGPRRWKGCASAFRAPRPRVTAGGTLAALAKLMGRERPLQRSSLRTRSRQIHRRPVLRRHPWRMPSPPMAPTPSARTIRRLSRSPRPHAKEPCTGRFHPMLSKTHILRRSPPQQRNWWSQHQRLRPALQVGAFSA
jgi:hypothetical protein